MTVASYLRISDEDKNKKKTEKIESDSIVNQRNLISDFIRNEPAFRDADIVEFCDDGWSGRNFGRPAVMEMLEQVRKDQIQCIIVKDLSRFGRNYLEVGNYIFRVFPVLGVRFIAINDGFDSIRTMDAESLEVSFQSLVSDFYSRDLSYKVKNALYFKAQQGKYVAAFAPFGYMKDQKNKNQIVPDMDAAQHVRCIFQMASEGMSTMQIACEMNKRQILTPMQYKRIHGCGRTVWNCVHENNFWTPETIIKILRDERYTGKAVFGKRKREEMGNIHQVKVKKADWIIVENAHESIISQEQFDYVQKKLRMYAQRGTVCKSRNPLKRKVRCGVCGRAMIRVKNVGNPYYTCQTPLMTDAYTCSAERIAEDDILETVRKNIWEQTKYAVDFSHIWEEEQYRESQDTEVIRKAFIKLKESCDKLENDLQGLYERFVFGELSKQAYFDSKKAVLERRQNISAQMEKLEIVLKKVGTDGKQENKRFHQYTKIKELTGNMIVDVLQEVIVYPKKILNIVWNCRDNFDS